MNSSQGFDVLLALFGDGRTVAIGTWYFVDGEYVPPKVQGRLKPKARSFVASKVSCTEAVVTYPRSASREATFEHPPHNGHDCNAYFPGHGGRAHDCHVNAPGWIDPELPVSYQLSELGDFSMCVEDDGSSLLEFLQGEITL